MHKLALLLTISATPNLWASLNLEKFNQAVQDLTDNLDDIQVHKETIITPVYVPSTVSTTTSHFNNHTSTVTTVTPPAIQHISRTHYHYHPKTKVAGAALQAYQRAYSKLNLKIFLKNCQSGIANGLISYLVPAGIEYSTNLELTSIVPLTLGMGLLTIGCYQQLDQPTTPYYQLPELNLQSNLFGITDSHSWATIWTQLSTASLTYLGLKMLKSTYLNR